MNELQYPVEDLLRTSKVLYPWYCKMVVRGQEGWSCVRVKPHRQSFWTRTDCKTWGKRGKGGKESQNIARENGCPFEIAIGHIQKYCTQNMCRSSTQMSQRVWQCRLDSRCDYGARPLHFFEMLVSWYVCTAVPHRSVSGGTDIQRECEKVTQQRELSFKD